MKKSTKIGVLIAVVIVAIVGCTAPKTVITTNPDGSQSTNTVQAIHPKVAETGETFVAVGPLVPPPYGWIVSAIGALIVAGGTGVANYKNARKADKWEDVATTVIQGVEAVTGEAGKIVKKAIETRSTTDGNHDLVRDIVAAETKIVS